MKVILVPVADRPECARALKTAFDLGQRLDASIIGCHIRDHSYSKVSMPTDLGLFGGIDAEWEKAWKKKKTASSHAKALALFGKVAEKFDYELIKRPRVKPGALWNEKVGSPGRILTIHGPVSDMLVVSRPATKGGTLASIFLNAALLNSARPVLILPQKGDTSIGKRIAIAWNQSSEAARAVAAVLPLLEQAAEVSIVTFGPENALGPKSSHLANYLAHRGITAKRVRTRGKGDAEAILNSYRETKSDLLVMGAYSRSRFRERIFGGVTDYMLHKANIPVLMLHS
jgi:nucleotide-binding universal stress UspA family protein